jgi:hypothetical protein
VTATARQPVDGHTVEIRMVEPNPRPESLRVSSISPVVTEPFGTTPGPRVTAPEPLRDHE